MTRTHTYTYSVLDVSEQTYADIKQRLLAALDGNNVDDYITDSPEGELIVLGTVALRVEKLDAKDETK